MYRVVFFSFPYQFIPRLSRIGPWLYLRAVDGEDAGVVLLFVLSLALPEQAPVIESSSPALVSLKTLLPEVSHISVSTRLVFRNNFAVNSPPPNLNSTETSIFLSFSAAEIRRGFFFFVTAFFGVAFFLFTIFYIIDTRFKAITSDHETKMIQSSEIGNLKITNSFAGFSKRQATKLS